MVVVAILSRYVALDLNFPLFYKSLKCRLFLQKLWRYGKGDASQEKYGSNFVIVGCSKSSRDEEVEEASDVITMKKWLVDVQCEGCKGLFYRSAPGVIVPDADWPRNGDVVVGYEIPNVPGTASMVGLRFCLQMRNFLFEFF